MALALGNGNVIEVKLQFQIDGAIDIALNVLHYVVSSMVGVPSSTTDGMSTIANAMLTQWGTPWATAACAGVGMIGVSATDTYPLPRSATVVAVPDDPLLGEVPGDPLPMQDGPTLLKLTDVGTRWGLGRMFIAGLAESSQVAGVITVGAATALEDLIACIPQVVTATGDGWSCMLTPVLRRGPSDNPVSLTVIRAGRLSDRVLKTQRRRRPGKGS